MYILYVHMNEKQEQSVNARVDALNMCQYCVCVCVCVCACVRACVCVCQ